MVPMLLLNFLPNILLSIHCLSVLSIPTHTYVYVSDPWSRCVHMCGYSSPRVEPECLRHPAISPILGHLLMGAHQGQCVYTPPSTHPQAQ